MINNSTFVHIFDRANLLEQSTNSSQNLFSYMIHFGGERYNKQINVIQSIMENGNQVQKDRFDQLWKLSYAHVTEEFSG
jgi:hypothetical protein